MASLNTLRTKFGVALSVVIALALLAFIFSLRTEMGFSDNDPKVGVINGDKISYSEYINEYETVKANNGGSEASDEQADALANATWQALVAKHLLIPGFEDMGIAVSDAERMAMISGEHPSQVFYNAFADPQTGGYDVAMITSYLSQMSANPQYQAFWSYLNSQAALDRMMSKFMGVVKAGVYANSLEVEQGVAAANESRSGRLVALKYNTIADSTVTVSNAEIKKYYDEHKNSYKKLPHRAISYVLFEVEPTDDDMLALEKEVRAAGEEFAAAEDVRAFVRKNIKGAIADHYSSAAQLGADEAVLLDGEQYGPVLKANEWVMSRAIATKTAPDSIGLSHIVLPAQQAALADSLFTALKAGGDFAAAASQYSAYPATAQNGGELGVMPFSSLATEIADQLADAKKGDIIKVDMGDAVQIMKITRADAPKKHVLVGTITYPVEASSATRRNIHNTASVFSVDGKGSIENFNAAANAAAVTPRVARISQGERELAGLENSREMVRWAYGAKEGEISEIFNLGNDGYAVAMLTDIDDSKYTPMEDVSFSIAQNLGRDKKFEILKEKLAGSSIDEIAKSAGAEVVDFSELRLSDFTVGDLGLEPRVVGAIATTEQTGQVSAPVKGYSSAVVFVVDDIAKSDAQTAEAEKVRLQATQENKSLQSAVMALQRMSEIEDLRGKYF